jgi:hypothetical protein
MNNFHKASSLSNQSSVWRGDVGAVVEIDFRRRRFFTTILRHDCDREEIGCAAAMVRRTSSFGKAEQLHG